MHLWICTLEGRRGDVVHLIDLAILADHKVDAEVAALKKMGAVQPEVHWFCAISRIR